mmetsp:Transcript_29662/g.71278  ORF Transcript_29662/g.71278 Transcript_29662/m.71278 type:complete len:302 (-) Transcript_29662:59-964(-)
MSLVELPNDCDESFEDIRSKLAQSTTWKHGERPGIQAFLPSIDDMLQARKAPPVDRAAVGAAAKEAYSTRTPFNSLTCPFSREMSSSGFIQGRYLTPWEQVRCDQPEKIYERRTQTPSGQRAKPWKSSSHPALFRPATTEGCTQQVQEAVKDHMAQREAHLFPNYVAQKKIQKQREEEEKKLAAQLLRRTNTQVKASATKDLMKIAVTRSKTRASAAVISRPEGAPKPRKIRPLTPHDLHGTAIFRDVNRTGREFSSDNPWQLAMEDDACTVRLAAMKTKKMPKKGSSRSRSAGNLLVVGL